MYNNNYFNRVNNQFSLNDNINYVVNGNLDENLKEIINLKQLNLI